MLKNVTAVILTCLGIFLAVPGFAFDCSGLPEWSRQTSYQAGDQVQLNGTAYEAIAPATTKNQPTKGDPWVVLGACDTGGSSSSSGGSSSSSSSGSSGGSSSGGSGTPMSIYGVWHCGNHYCDWSQPRDTAPGAEFDQANHWIIDRGDGTPSVNLVILSFLEPMKLLNQTTDENFLNGIPRGMTSDVVDYFKAHGIRVMVSMGGLTYTDAWDTALVTDAEGLAMASHQAVLDLGLDGFEIDWENGTPSADQLAGIETFIDTYRSLSGGGVLTMDLAVGNRYLQELSRRASADWLPNGKLDYINAMVPRGEPTTDQWQEHVDGKFNYNPPILPKAPAKVAVSMWLTDGNQPNENCVDFLNSTQLAKGEFVQNVQPNGAGSSNGFLGYMFWAAECPSTRNACTLPPNSCESGMGTGAEYFDIPIPIGTLRQD
ncbi:carbohydrate-binding protein [Microbulbifer pacificus]|uniref:carbohydrate-binding protein n=1 Tax=Microbulbifer pacificus TaxID=407164 RepID=UPI000CF444D7|nr:carbohydrate-binding protein [Microbulbifer pacificus]